MEFINSLEGFIEKPETIKLRMERLVGMDLEAVVGHILNSTAQQWTVDPSFYLAVLRHGGKRMRAVKAIVERARST